jgi:hypothetical protein
MSGNALIGTGWLFPPSFAKPSSGPTMTFNEERIDQSIYVILNTMPGERIMDEFFGSQLGSYSFGVVNQTFLTDIKVAIANALKSNEPRIKLLSIKFDSSSVSEGLLSITLEYSIIESNNIRNMVYPMYVQNA